MENKNISQIKNKSYFCIIGIIIGIIIILPFMINLKKSEKKYTSEIISLKNLKQTLKSENLSLQKKIESLNETTKKLEEQLATFDTTEYEGKINKLNSEISLLTSQRDSLNEEITKMTSAEDIILTAGNYVVGTDIKPGKYDAIAQRGRGNLFVRGTTRVNEMLGLNDDYYIPSYKNITLKDGDTIEITSSLSVLFQAK